MKSKIKPLLIGALVVTLIYVGVMAARGVSGLSIEAPATCPLGCPEYSQTYTNQAENVNEGVNTQIQQFLGK